MTKQEFDNFLDKLELNKKDLAELLNMPYNTINGWNGSNKPFPSWLASWFIHYEKSLKYDKIKEITKEI